MQGMTATRSQGQADSQIDCAECGVESERFFSRKVLGAIYRHGWTCDACIAQLRGIGVLAMVETLRDCEG